jgi:hypothetical protein
MTELVEDEQRVITHAAEMTVPGGALLRSMGRADRAIHIQRDPLRWLAFLNSVDPLTRHISQCSAIVGGCQHLGLETPHLACRGGIGIHSPSADDLPHNRIKRQTIRVIHIIVPGQPIEDRLAQQTNQCMQPTVTRPRVSQQTTRNVVQAEDFIQFPE